MTDDLRDDLFCNLADLSVSKYTRIIIFYLPCVGFLLAS